MCHYLILYSRDNSDRHAVPASIGIELESISKEEEVPARLFHPGPSW